MHERRSQPSYQKSKRRKFVEIESIQSTGNYVDDECDEQDISISKEGHSWTNAYEFFMHNNTTNHNNNLNGSDFKRKEGIEISSYVPHGMTDISASIIQNNSIGECELYLSDSTHFTQTINYASPLIYGCSRKRIIEYLNSCNIEDDNETSISRSSSSSSCSPLSLTESDNNNNTFDSNTATNNNNVNNRSMNVNNNYGNNQTYSNFQNCVNRVDSSFETQSNSQQLLNLILFFLENNPYHISECMYAHIHGFLTENIYARNKVNDYFNALLPSSVSLTPSNKSSSVSELLSESIVAKSGSEDVSVVSQNSFSDEVSDSTAKGSSNDLCLLKSDELTLVRIFLLFSLAYLHTINNAEIDVKKILPQSSVQGMSMDSEKDVQSSFSDCRSALFQCSEIWWSYAKIYL
jgi:hypothetical protein